MEPIYDNRVSVKNKLGFIDGSIECPTSDHLPAWISNNHVEQQSVSLYFTKLKTVWDELHQFRPVCTCTCTCGGAKSVSEFLQLEYIINLLMGLDEFYGSTRAELLLMDPPPSVNKALSLVRQDEQQRSIGTSATIPTAPSFALVAQHSASKPPSKATNYVMNQKLHGYPPGYRSGQRFSPGSQNPGASKSSEFSALAASHANSHAISHYQQLFQLLQSQLSTGKFVADTDTTTSYTVDTDTQSLILDFGASAHICGCRKLFDKIHKISPVHVNLPNKPRFVVEYSGFVRLSDHLSIHGVLYIPEFYFNLISVNVLLRDMPSLSVEFTNDTCIIQDKSISKTIDKGRLCHGLYLLDNTSECSSTVQSICVSAFTLVSFDVWHNRLGHPSFTRLPALKSVLPVDNCSLEDFLTDSCDFPFLESSGNDVSVNPFPDLVLPNVIDFQIDMPADHIDMTNADIDIPAVVPTTIISPTVPIEPCAPATVPSADGSSSTPVVSEPMPNTAPSVSTPMSNTGSSIVPLDIVPRRSTRPSKMPSYLQDFHCSLLTNSLPSPASTRHPLQQYLSYSRLSSAH
ncbi:uncharacterized protein LOC111013441 [Momordica charantia]|uniref:Uncharacterized protein LOC111013441 n=1 Tax=Momordica charantia TaxID=3673 RepID=A0A6J1CR17_MOMCH|nr:uncharacterized protein LOC111013441 [Momordica charantia]